MRPGGGAAAARARRARGRGWARTALAALVTAVVLVPVAVVPWRLVHPAPGFAGGWGAGLRGAAGQVRQAFTGTDLLSWLWHSTQVTVSTVVVSMLVAVPAGYVLARSRSRAVSGYALGLFALQSFPVVLLAAPLFVVLARLGLVDRLSGLTVVYIAVAVPVATWMVATALAEVPVALEQAAWLDGCSPAGALVRVVLPAAGPAVLAAALYAFVITWNDYVIASVFVHGQERLVLPLGLATGGGPVTALVMLVPPVVAYAVGQTRLGLGGSASAVVG